MPADRVSSWARATAAGEQSEEDQGSGVHRVWTFRGVVTFALAWTLAQVSRRVTVRLKTGRSAVASLSTQK